MASTVEILIRARDQYSAALKKADKNMRTLVATGAALAGAGLAVTGALVKMAQQSANLGDQFQKSSIKTGVATEQLSALKFAAEQSGTSFETVEKSLIKLARNANEAAQGTKTQADAFEALGVSVTDANGNLRPMNDLLLDSADRFALMENETEKAALAQDIFGKSGVDMLPLLNEGREGIKAYTDQASDLGVVYSQDLANSSADLLDALNKLGSAMAGISLEISETVIPAMTKVVNVITPWIIKTRKLIDAHPELVRLVGVLAVALTGSGGLLLGFAGIVKVLPIFKTALAGVGGWITPLVIFIAALSFNLFTMRTELASVALFIKSKFLGLLSKLVGAINLLPKAINPFSDKLADLESALADMALEADDSSNALLIAKDAMEDAQAAALDMGRETADTVVALEDVTTAVEGETRAFQTLSEFLVAEHNQAMLAAENKMKDAAIAAADLELGTLGMTDAIEGIPVPPSIFTQEWAKPQVANADKMLDGFETHTKETVDAIIAEADRQKTAQVQAAKDAAENYKATFTSIKDAFGDTFQSFATSGKLSLGKVKDLFATTFSAVFFEDILGSFVSSFITPLVQALRDGLIGVFANLGIGALKSGAGAIGGKIAGGTAGKAASTVAGVAGNVASVATGGLSALATGIGSFVGTLVAGLFQKNKQVAIEENTRFTHLILTDMMNDRLQPMKETLNWSREIQTGILGKLGEDIVPTLEDSKILLEENRDDQKDIGAKTHAQQKTIADQTHDLLQAVVAGVKALDRARESTIVLDDRAIGVFAEQLNRFVEQDGGQLVASATVE